ncbi:jg26555 [Pararge aegeria aegeria]|uniref:Jg26555 protein n=1 Tax=Pararge aegeria aegeria TaxID=348720 RepID=A0A8S4QRP8_9NEOP|nr:jg26555 [Pararge aegeria aegeria]
MKILLRFESEPILLGDGDTDVAVNTASNSLCNNPIQRDLGVQGIWLLIICYFLRSPGRWQLVMVHVSVPSSQPGSGDRFSLDEPFGRSTRKAPVCS